MAAWLFVFVPVCGVLLVFLRGHWFLPLFLIWWLSPMFDRAIVHVLSRAVFGEVPPLLETLRELPRVLGRGLLLGLTLHRLHPARVLVQPIAQLEGVRGSQRRQRELVLARRGGGIAWGASVCSLLFHISLAAGASVLLVSLTPDEFLPDFGRLSEMRASSFDALQLGWLARAVQLIWIGAYCVIEPFNAAIGFGQYVNRRTQLEGWDIEVAFRRLNARLERQGPRARTHAGTAVALLALAFFAFGARSAVAQDSPPPVAAEPAASETPSEAIERILAGPDFDTHRTDDEWYFDFDWKPNGQQRGLDLSWLAKVLELLLWALLAAVLVFIVVQVAKRVGWLESMRVADAPEPPPTHLFGLDLRPESLPADIAAAAWELWTRGEAVAALGLLYRASISRLVERDGLALESSDTENDCLRRARSLGNEARVGYFNSVTGAWLKCAYSGARPTAEFVEQLCRDWNERFEAKAA